MAVAEAEALHVNHRRDFQEAVRPPQLATHATARNGQGRMTLFGLPTVLISLVFRCAKAHSQPIIGPPLGKLVGE
jgi:hypothetical protein